MNELTASMDAFMEIVNSTPAVDAPERLMRQAGQMEPPLAVEALARLLVGMASRERHCRAQLTALRQGGGVAVVSA